MRLSENAHLPFGGLTALSEVEGLRYPHPSSLRRTSMYASLLGISGALHLDIFHQPFRSWFFDSLHVDSHCSQCDHVLQNCRRTEHFSTEVV